MGQRDIRRRGRFTFKLKRIVKNTNANSVKRKTSEKGEHKKWNH